MSLTQTALETTIGFILLFIVTKILGKEQIAQITLFDFISAMVLGEIIGNALYDSEITLQSVVLSLTIWVSLKLTFEKISLKFLTLRSFLDSKPNVLIRNGKIDVKELKKSRLTLHQLLMMIREKNATSLAEVSYAILEIGGKLTVIKKPEFRTPTLKDLNIKPSQTSLPMTLIIDGQVLKNNLQMAGLDLKWLEGELRKVGNFNPQQILYAELTEDKELYVAEKVFL